MHSGNRVKSKEPRGEDVRIVFDHPRRHVGRRASRSVGKAAGTLLILIGLLASIGAVPATFAVLALLAGWITSEPLEELAATETVIAWAILTSLATSGLYYGLRLLRRHRTLVLFLRRFGHDEAQQAVSFAVLRTIGPYWRIVTLDDAEMAPIGIPAATRTMFRVGALSSKRLARLTLVLGLWTYPRLIWAMLIVIAVGVAGPALDFFQTGSTTADPWLAALDPYFDTLSTALEGRPPLEDIGPTLPGIFALLVTAAFFSFLLLLGTLVVLLLMFPLSAMLLFISSSAKAASEAEAAKIVRVKSESEVREAAKVIANRSRRVFGPRLVVLKVTTPQWQIAVRELATRASIVLLDVSEPTKNVLWELEELTIRGAPCVVIGEYERVARLAAAGTGGTVMDALTQRVGGLLRGRDILAYTVDTRGLTRFAHALRSILLDST